MREVFARIPANLAGLGLTDGPQSSFAATCGARTLSSTRSLIFRTVAVSASICFCCRATVVLSSAIVLCCCATFPCSFRNSFREVSFYSPGLVSLEWCEKAPNRWLREAPMAWRCNFCLCRGFYLGMVCLRLLAGSSVFGRTAMTRKCFTV